MSHFAECNNADCSIVDCYYAVNFHSECHSVCCIWLIAIIMSVMMLIVVMLSIFFSVIMLNAIWSLANEDNLFVRVYCTVLKLCVFKNGMI